ncbi:MAG: MFS transporter [Candidatus Latescibacterota bacterium]
MFKKWFVGFDLREYNPNVQRFYLFAIPIFSGMALFVLLHNLYLIRLGYQEDFIGQLIGLFSLASGLVAIPTGFLSDRYGRKPFLIGASLCVTVSHLGLCFVTDSTILLVLSCLGGAGGGFIFENFIPFLAENASPERRAQAIAIWMSIGVITRMVVNLLGGALPDVMSYFTGMSTDLPEPFQYALLFGAACSFVSIFPLLGMQSNTPKHKSEEEDDQSPIPYKNLATFATISAFRGLAMGLSFPFFNVFFQEELDVATAVIGTVFFASMVLGLPLTMSAPGMARRFGTTLTIVPLRALGAVALTLMGLWLNFPLAVAFFLISTAVESLTTPTEMTFATNSLSRPYWGRMQSLRVTGFQCLSAIGSIWAGFLIVEHGYWAAFALAGFARLGSALTFLIVFGYQKTSQEV